ncbi:hypothetical protein DSECCO2_643370 [anaerobic digester metagenome]
MARSVDRFFVRKEIWSTSRREGLERVWSVRETPDPDRENCSTTTLQAGEGLLGAGLPEADSCGAKSFARSMAPSFSRTTSRFSDRSTGPTVTAVFAVSTFTGPTLRALTRIGASFFPDRSRRTSDTAAPPLAIFQAGATPVVAVPAGLAGADVEGSARAATRVARPAASTPVVTDASAKVRTPVRTSRRAMSTKMPSKAALPSCTPPASPLALRASPRTSTLESSRRGAALATSRNRFTDASALAAARVMGRASRKKGEYEGMSRLRASTLTLAWSGVTEKDPSTPSSSPSAVKARTTAWVVALTAVLRPVTVTSSFCTSLVKGVGIVSSLNRTRPSVSRTSGICRSRVLAGCWAVSAAGDPSVELPACAVALAGACVAFSVSSAPAAVSTVAFSAVDDTPPCAGVALAGTDSRVK